MPEKLDRCVTGVLAGWKKNPDKAPKRFKSGDEMKPIKTNADRESAAYAICQASLKAEMTGVGDITLQSEGFGPTMVGVAALNDPHITGMKRLEVVSRDDKEFIKGQVLRLGTFRHQLAPKGRLTVDDNLFFYLISNFKDGVLGRAVFLDPAHEPNKGAFGEVVEVVQEGDGLFYYTDPTPLGLQSIKDRLFNYSSIWMNYNWQGTQVRMSSAEMVEDDSFIPIEEVDMDPKTKDPKDPKVVTPPATTGDNGELKLSQEQLDELLARAVETVTTDLSDKHELELKALTKQSETMMTELKAEIDESRAGRAMREEELRLESVDLFVKGLGQPDRKGFAMATPLSELIASALRGDSVNEGGENELKLSAEPEDPIADVHAYYRGVIAEIAEMCPRTVPTGRFIEARDRQPGQVTLEAFKDRRRADLISVGVEIHGYSDDEAAKRADRVLADVTEVPNA